MVHTENTTRSHIKTAMAPRRMRYIRDIPVPIFQQICGVLDDLTGIKNWKHLAGLLGFSNNQIAMFNNAMRQPGGSPTETMLTTWDYQNHTIEELYLKLNDLQHARCMTLLKDLVRPDLHYMIERITNTDPLPNPDPPELNIGPAANQLHHRGHANIPPGHENRFSRNVPPMPPSMGVPSSQANLHYPPQLPNHPPYPQPPQNQWSQHGSAATPSTASYHTNSANLPFHPVDQKMMMSTRPQQASPKPNSRPEYGRPQSQGNDLMRVPSEHALGAPQRYQSHHSNDDNMAVPPAVSPEYLPACRQPVFESLPQSHPSQPPHSTSSQTSSPSQSLTANFIGVPYEKLCRATENFSAARRLGAGAFGEVFHAQLDIIDVAIKKIIKNDNIRFNQSMIRADQIKEIEALTKYRYKHIVSLIGYSFGDDCMCLIFDFMKNGSLDYQLEGRAPQGPLKWRTRHMIAEGASLGIQYLHTFDSKRPLVHQDIKSANILLDDHFVPKIADFGLARPGPANGKEYIAIKSEVVFGTAAYLAPEFMRDPKRKLSTRLDVYSFGIVLLEIVTGEKAGQAKRRFRTDELLWRCVDQIMEDNKGHLQNAAEILQDPMCRDWPSHYMMEMVQLAMLCTEEFRQRPEMEKVIHTLSEIGARIEQDEGHNRSSRTHNFPIEKSEPLQQGKGEESSDPSEKTEYRASANPGLPGSEGEAMVKNPAYVQYAGYQTLADGPAVRGDMNRGNQHAVESVCRKAEQQFYQEYRMMKEGMRQGKPFAQERQMPMQPADYYDRAYGPQYGTPTSGNSSVDRHGAASQSSMSPSPGSSYPSYLQSPSISSSDTSGAYYPEHYIGQPGEYYPNPHQQGAYGQPVRYAVHQARPEMNPMDDGRYRYHYPHDMQHPRFTQHPHMGPVPRNVGYQPDGYHPDGFRDGFHQRFEDLNIKGSVRSTQDNNQMHQTPPVASSVSSSSSNLPGAYPEYPKVPTLHIPELSYDLSSSDTSGITGDTSLSQSESSKDLPQREVRGGNEERGGDERGGGREQIGILQSAKEGSDESSNQVNRREPDQNTEPQAQDCQ